MTGTGDLLSSAKELTTLSSNPIAAVFKRHPSVVLYAATYARPDPQSITLANYMLKIYYEFSKNLPKTNRNPILPGIPWV